MSNEVQKIQKISPALHSQSGIPPINVKAEGNGVAAGVVNGGLHLHIDGMPPNININKIHPQENKPWDRSPLRVFENSTLLLLVIGSLLLDSVAMTKRLKFPSFDISNIIPVDSTPLVAWQSKLFFALIVAILAVFVVKMAQGGKLKIAILDIFILLNLTVIFCALRSNDYRVTIYTLQQIIVASYVLICYGMASFFKNYLPKRILTSKVLARCLYVLIYFLIHISLVIFCNWSWLYRRVYVNPATVIWMAIAFMIGYAEVFWIGKNHGREKFISRRQKLFASICSVSVQTFVLSFHRLEMIFSSLWSPSGDATEFVDGKFYPTRANWLLYRINILHSTMMTGKYPAKQLDPITLDVIRDFHIVWLGVAFERWQQLLYISIVISLLLLLVWMYRTHRGGSLFNALVLGIIASNLWGIICEMNLIYSVELGVMVSRNVFQLIPLACLLYLNGYAEGKAA